MIKSTFLIEYIEIESEIELDLRCLTFDCPSIKGYLLVIALLFNIISLQGWNYFLCQRFSACFVLKVAPQRGEGEKRGMSANFKVNHPEPLTSEIIPPQ